MLRAVAYIFLFYLSITNIWAASVTVIPITQKKSDTKAHYSIVVNSPKFIGVEHSLEANQAVQALMASLINKFNETRLTFGNKPIFELPLDENSNRLEITYQTMSISPQFVSIRFAIYTNFYGAAHPFTDYKSFNYDFIDGKSVQLNDLFATQDYLEQFSRYSKKYLTTTLSKMAAASIEPDANGLKPIAKNYAVWNITPTGLLITFPAYQVAPYVFGAQKVLIPKALIKTSLSELGRHLLTPSFQNKNK